MAMLKYGSATVVEPDISSEQWQKSVCCGHKSCTCGTKSCRVKVARMVLAKYDPEKYLLSHCSIIAAVDVDNAKTSKSEHKDYLIKPEYGKFVNNNGDAWTKSLLAKTYKTFIGANNWTEHVQIPELSKGKVIDAVLREVPIGKDKKGKDISTYYVDILVATERKHKDLVAKIENGEMSSLSMGCFLEGTEITMSDGIKRPIEEIKSGDMVITHTGNVQPVLNVQKRWYSGFIKEFEIEGNYKITRVTPEHPFWAFKRERICACGCGEKIETILSGHEDYSENGHPIFSRFKLGHYARIVNPNANTYSFNEYKRLKEENPIREPLSLSWEKAGDLKERDIVSYPVSKKTLQDKNATIEKARLIGYFLAEGSFVKEVIVIGEENDYGIKCRICGGIYNMIGTHLPVHKMEMYEYIRLYPEAPLKAKIRKKLIRTKSRREDLGIPGLTRERKRIGAEFSLGEHEYDTLNKEIYELALKVFPKASTLRYKNAVKIIGVDVADFFFKYCNEYAEGKCLPEEVMYWDHAIQKHIIATWVLGDYSTTISKKLSDQLRFLLYRLRINHNAYYVAESLYQTDVKQKAVNGEEIVKHYEGVRSASYMLQLNAQAYDVLHNELNYSFSHTVPKKLESIVNMTKVRNNWKNSHNLDCMIRPIQKITEVPYEGWVYNFEVAGDNSYIANDMAVHNCKIAYSICTKCGNKAIDETQACDHVRYEKNNTFYHEDGTQRKIAELCGHSEDPDSVTFIDASWVKNPAFTGAVVRNVVNPPEDIMAKIREAEAKEAYKTNAWDFLKAAKVKAQDKAPGNEDALPTDEKTPPEDTENPPEDTPDEKPDDEDKGAPTDEAPADEGAPAEEESPEDEVQTLKKQLKQQILKELGDQIMNDFSGEGDKGPRELETLEENLIQPTAALKSLWTSRKAWNQFLVRKAGYLDKKNFDKLRFGSYILLSSNDLGILSNYGFNRRDFLAVMSFLDSFSKKPLDMAVKKAVAKMNGTRGRNAHVLVTELQKHSGKVLTSKEICRGLAWLQAMDSY